MSKLSMFICSKISILGNVVKSISMRVYHTLIRYYTQYPYYMYGIVGFTSCIAIYTLTKYILKNRNKNNTTNPKGYNTDE